jgi:Holliday junction resolvase RusA-like endonuclease
MMRAVLPYPPSANRYWRTFRNRTVVSDEARKYKALVKVELSKWPLLAGPVALIAHLYRPQRSGDLDNRLKVLGDALNGVAWSDDSQVVEIHAYRHDDKARPRVEVEVRALGVEGVVGPMTIRKAWDAVAKTKADGIRIPVHQANLGALAGGVAAGVFEYDGAKDGYVVTPAYQKAQTAAVVPPPRSGAKSKRRG